MKPLLLFLMVFLGVSQGVLSQTYTLSGEVKDDTAAAIPFASVFLLATTDSTLVKGTSADENGFFAIDGITEGLYFLKASYIGQTSENLTLDIIKDVKIGALMIAQSSQVLDEVVVTAGRPVVERKVDRLVFNVENTVLSQSSSWEILQQTPGVISMQDELQIRNQAATIYINDRKVQLSSEEVRNLLENYQGENIKSIEVLSNPPARYDAEGGPVLNIVTSNNISLGYKGNINTRYTQGVFAKYNIGTSHFYKTEKLNLNASYSFAPRKVFKDVESITNFNDDTGIFSRWETDFDQTNRFETHNIGLVLDYTFDDRNELSLTSNAQLSPERTYDYFQDTRIENGQGTLDSTFTTASFLDETKNNISADLTFKHTFEEKGSLTLNGHYTHFDLQRSQEVNSDYFLPSGDFIRDFDFFTNARQDIEIGTAQLDYSTLFGTVSFESGIKASFIDSQSKLDFFDLNNGQVPVAELSDDYLYDEQVYAGYFSLSKDWEKWSLKAGLRAEQTESSGNSVALSTINELSYFELFPTLYVLHNVNENHSFAFDYSRKLTRPRYEDLNPFRTFVNENLFFDGNPNLLPNFSNNFNLNYTLKQEFFFDFYYRDNGNYISTLTFQNNENQTLRDVTQNVLESTSYGFDFNYGKSITNNWYLYSYISIFHEDETFLALESNNVPARNEFDGFYADLTNYLTLSKDGTLKGELGLTYLSGFLQGSSIQAETTNLTFGLRKSFWKRRALVSLAVNDILGKANGRVTSKYLNQDNNFLAIPETQYVRFGFTYNFGNYRLEDNDREIDKIERERLSSEE
ncbi:outer membrane beta-barrel family protein [Maribacter sp. 4U21]|uniref:outer membrane beta-barrel family protein n=1 Tax=Maribacter sp. 4U21 TaxID=1889779 RepID=UPI00211DF064|nr:outer membrane beta-barrel family protein [Maribacter sp. 4U21]